MPAIETESLFELPTPDETAIAHSRRLCQFILEQIAAGNGSISFEKYMQAVLYAPGLGYYSAGTHKFGSEGDFVTAPEICEFFGQVLAIQTLELLKQLKHQHRPANILEVGAGSGKMAVDILTYLQELGQLPDHYYILELSAELKQRQYQHLAAQLPDYIDQIIWLDSLPENFSGMVLANELLDAMPCHLFKYTPSTMYQAQVVYQNERFQLEFVPAQDTTFLQLHQKLEQLFKDNPVTIDEYISELNLFARHWISSMAKHLQYGGILLVDYGYPLHEYYHPQRNMGTLRCHYQHRVHNDPFVYPGLQDITAHVNFSDIARSGVEAGLQLSGYTTQAHFLLAGGLQDLLSSINPDNSIKFAQKAATIKKLILPEAMGELFKVIFFTKHVDCSLSGFSFNNMQHKL